MWLNLNSTDGKPTLRMFPEDTLTLEYATDDHLYTQSIHGSIAMVNLAPGSPYPSYDTAPGVINSAIDSDSCNCGSGATTIDLVTFQSKLMEEIKDTLFDFHRERDTYHRETRANTLKTLVEVYTAVDQLMHPHG